MSCLASWVTVNSVKGSSFGGGGGYLAVAAYCVEEADSVDPSAT